MNHTTKNIIIGTVIAIVLMLLKGLGSNVAGFIDSMITAMACICYVSLINPSKRGE